MKRAASLGNVLALAGFCILTISGFTRQVVAQQHLLSSGAAAESPVAPVLAPLPVSTVIHGLEERNAQRTAALMGYTGTRVYRLEYKGFPGDRDAEMTVHVEFTAPGTKHFTIISESGSKMLVNRVLKKLLESEQEAASPENQRQVALTAANYQMDLVGFQPVPDEGRYTLRLTPKTGNKFLYRGDIVVDAHDFAVTHIAAEPARNPSFWIRKTELEHRYTEVEGFWLPAENRTISQTRMGGRATLTIEYRDYHITHAASASAGR